MKTYKNLSGRKIQKTPFTDPYGYDEFVVFYNFPKKTDNTIRTDEMIDTDPDLYNKCCRKIYNERDPKFPQRDFMTIHRFISMYLGQKVCCTAVMQGYNKNKNAPYWKFYYRAY